MQKARRHFTLRLLLGMRFQDLFHSPQRGSFHLSLTVLIHYRSLGSIQPWKMVLPDSDRITRVPPYLGLVQAFQNFRYETITLYGTTFQKFPLPIQVLYVRPATPTPKMEQVQASPISLAATIGISVDLFSYRYLDVSVPCVRLIKLCIHFMITQMCGVSPFRNLRIKTHQAVPRSLSQPFTSFIASQCQGIRRMPLVAYLRRLTLHLAKSMILTSELRIQKFVILLLRTEKHMIFLNLNLLLDSLVLSFHCFLILASNNFKNYYLLHRNLIQFIQLSKSVEKND